MKPIAEEIINQSIVLLQRHKKINKQKDIQLLLKLEKIAGSKIFPSEIIQPNNKLNLRAINKHRKALLNTLICIKQAAEYEKNIFEIEHCRHNEKKVKLTTPVPTNIQISFTFIFSKFLSLTKK